MTIFERRGRYYDEREVGDVFRHRPGRTITEAENVLFTTVTGNAQSVNLDEVFAQATRFGTRLVNSLYTLAVVFGLSVVDVTEGTTVANLGFERVQFPRHVVAGDTPYSATEVKSMRPSQSDPARGIVVFEHRGTNQREQLVCVAQRATLMYALRPPRRSQHRDPAPHPRSGSRRWSPATRRGL